MFVVELFTYDHIIEEFLMKVPLITFETSIAGLLKISMAEIYKHEKESIKEYLEVIIEENSNNYKLKENFLEELDNHLEIKNNRNKSNSWAKPSVGPVDDEPLTAEKIKELKAIAKNSDSEDSEEEEEEDSEDDKDGVKYIQEDDIESIKVAKKRKEKVFIVKQDSFKEDSKTVYTYHYGGKQSYNKVPLLIRLLNSIIHMSYQAETKKGRIHNLLNILSQGAKISPDLRKYYLANSMVGRLLDQFYGDLSKFNDIFRDLSTIPLFRTDIPCYIPEIENDSLARDFIEDVNTKEVKEMSFNEKYYTFFYELVSNLVCS